MRRLVRLAALAALGPSAVVALAALGRFDHRWPDLLVQFAAPALTATLALTALWALLRLRAPAFVGAGLSLLLLVAAWPQWRPDGATAAHNGETIRLYSANLWARNTDVEAIGRSIRAADADIVVLIELGDAPAARLDDILAGYPHRVTTPRIDRPSGAARSVIASRYPLREFDRRYDGLHAVSAAALTPLGPVNVVGAHLTRPWPFQYQWGQLTQVQALGRRLSPLQDPVIVAGDFNSVSTGRVGRMVRDETGLRPASGWLGTWPAALPGPLRITIDQVWVSDELAIRARSLGRPTGSDHRPVIVELASAARD